MQSMRAVGQPVLLATRTDGAWQLLLDRELNVRGGTGSLTDEVRNAAAEALNNDRSRVITTEAGDAVFLQVFNPPLRMIIVGAVHIAQFLAPMAVLAGYDVTIVDPRRAFAADERFPGVALHKVWPDDALDELAPDRRTAIVTLTHDAKIDDPALLAALKTEAFYIGSLGSNRTHAKRVDRLRDAGVTDLALDRIHAPLGLHIHAKSPAEIAVSALAEVTQTLRT
jgi:xanthine dehydrogenase accessory factor